MCYCGAVLPDWVDLQVVKVVVASATVGATVAAILCVAYLRRLVLRLGLSVVLVAGAVALLVYYRGPLHDAEESCHFHLLKSDVPVDHCVAPNDAASSTAAAR
jgi:hypothetical protein